MSITIVQSAGSGPPGTGQKTATLGSAPTTNNLLLFFVGRLHSATISTPPTGSTSFASFSGSEIGWNVYWRTVVGGDGTSWTETPSTDYSAMVVLELSGIAVGLGAFDNTPTTTNETSDVSSITSSSTVPSTAANQGLGLSFLVMSGGNLPSASVSSGWSIINEATATTLSSNYHDMHVAGTTTPLVAGTAVACTWSFTSTASWEAPATLLVAPPTVLAHKPFTKQQAVNRSYTY